MGNNTDEYEEREQERKKARSSHGRQNIDEYEEREKERKKARSNHGRPLPSSKVTWK
jgi:hypothetical protein